MAQLLLYQRLRGPLEERLEPIDGLRSHIRGLPLLHLHQQKGWGVNELLDARNECGPLPGTLGFPPGGKTLI